MKVFIKIKKSDIDNGIIPNTMSGFSNIFDLGIEPEDLIADKCIVHDIGDDFYYVYSMFFDNKNKTRYTKQNDDEINMINEFIKRYDLETISINDMNQLLTGVEL